MMAEDWICSQCGEWHSDHHKAPPMKGDEIEKIKALVDEILIGIRRKNPIKWAGIVFDDVGQALVEALTAAEARGYERAKEEMKIVWAEDISRLAKLLWDRNSKFKAFFSVAELENDVAFSLTEACTQADQRGFLRCREEAARVAELHFTNWRGAELEAAGDEIAAAIRDLKGEDSL